MGAIGNLRFSAGEEVEWVHFLDIFGEESRESRRLFHIEEVYRTSMVQRMRVRIIHADAMSVPVGLIGVKPQSTTKTTSTTNIGHGRNTLKQTFIAHDDISSDS